MVNWKLVSLALGLVIVADSLGFIELSAEPFSLLQFFSEGIVTDTPRDIPPGHIGTADIAGSAEPKVIYDPYQQCVMMEKFRKELDNFTVTATADDYSAWMEKAVAENGFIVPTVYFGSSMYDAEGVEWRIAKENFALPVIPLYVDASKGIPTINIIVPPDVKFLGSKSNVTNARLYFMKNGTSVGVGEVSGFKEQHPMLDKISDDSCVKDCIECGCKPGTFKETHTTHSGAEPILFGHNSRLPLVKRN